MPSRSCVPSSASWASGGRERGRLNPSPQPPPLQGEGEQKVFLPLSASGRGLGGGVSSQNSEKTTCLLLPGAILSRLGGGSIVNRTGTTLTPSTPSPGPPCPPT